MLYVLVGATLVANIYKSRLKSLLQLYREIVTVGRNGTISNPSPLRLRASAVKHELRCRQAGINELAASAPVILVRNAG
jgi:hypothetical protein